MTTSRNRNQYITECWIPIRVLADDWISRIVECLPHTHRPMYFGGSERLDKRRAQSVSNQDALRRWTKQHSSAELHGDHIYLSAISWDNTIGCTLGHFRPSPAAMAIIRAWFRKLDALNLVYAKALHADEDHHRHDIAIDCVGGLNGRVLMLIGRDYTKYVPGLYWLNYLSRKYAEQRHLDVPAIAAQLQGELEVLPNGHMLRLYDSPDDWLVNRERIDSILECDSRFFSLKRAAIPGAVDHDKCDAFMAAIQRQWP